MSHSRLTAVLRTSIFWCVIAFVGFGALGLVVYRSFQSLMDTSRWVSHTHDVITSLQETLAQVQAIEANARLHLLAKEINSLKTAQTDAPAVLSSFDRLRTLTVDNSDQQAHLDRIQPKLRAKMAAVASIGGNASITPADVSMADIEEVLEEMIRDEKALRRQRQESAHASAQTTLAVSGVGMAAGLAIMLAAFVLIHRESRRRRTSEESLRDVNGSLESSLSELHRITRETALITTLGDFLQTCKNPSEAYTLLARTIPRLLPDVQGAVGIISNSRNLVEVSMTFGGETITGAEFSPDECWGLRRGRQHVATPHSCEPMCEHLESAHAGYLCLPMVAHGETLGVLSIATHREGGLTENEVKTVHAAAEQMSLALANLRLQETLRVQSIRDPLTGLFNRRYMEASLEREFTRARRANVPVSVIMLDVDHFKRFNDTHGHEAGDILLASLGELLTQQFRGEDIVCRYGGEEFALIMPGVDQQTARVRMEELREALKQMNVQFRRASLGNVTVSIGVASYPTHGETGDVVMATADAALYRAKKAGRDRIVAADEFPEPAECLSIHDRPAKAV